ncbi:MAG: hypothetical protein CME62_04170 [Halobacteriovoraceae bacterium]|nr:hypothetical protein [Halobacteriovoraceae bacterium]|tara:strand:- start:14768 stop:15550 length:783 start_codon:yes stop_codon:yes gene_type:complete
MKNILLVSTFTLLTSAYAQDYCSNLQREQARLADCQVALDRANAQVNANDRDIRLTERDINQQGKRDRELNQCKSDKAIQVAQSQGLETANGKADNRIAKVTEHNRDIQKRIGRNIIVKHECAAIYPETGNQTQYDRGDWGRFVGKKAIFFGEGITAEDAKNALLENAQKEGFFDNRDRGGFLGLGSRTSDKRKKKLLTSLTCFPVYNQEHAQGIKPDVENIAKEALAIKMPRVVAGDNDGGNNDNGGRRGRRRGGRRGN